LESKLRDDLERMKKIRLHRGLRHYWGLRVRGQHTKTTGRKGRTVGKLFFLTIFKISLNQLIHHFLGVSKKKGG
jgi:hypothetical protein